MRRSVRSVVWACVALASVPLAAAGEEGTLTPQQMRDDLALPRL